MDRLNILIVNGDLPVFPGWGGIEYLHTTHLAQIANKVGLVSLVHTREQSEKKHLLTEAGVHLYLWENPYFPVSSPGPSPQRPLLRRIGKAGYDFLLSLPRRPNDTLVQDFQLRNFSPHLLKALDEESWRVVVVVQSSCAGWLDYLPHSCASVLMLHDVRALIYERRARIPGPVLKKWASWLESRRYRHFEDSYCRKYDLVITVSSADEAWVRQHYRPKRLVTIPIPIDAAYFAPMADVPEAEARIVFTGMMNHPPNIDAACFFAKDVFPRVKKVIPEAEFWIVGRNPAPEVWALANLPDVTVTGFVPDIRPYMAQATVIVVPLRFGAGMRQKILEAWGMQKCVISTQIGAEGLDYEDGTNLLIADDARTLTERVIRVIRDPAMRNEMRTRGRELIIGQHHPGKLAQDYYDAVTSVVRTKQQRNGRLRAVIDLRWMEPGLAGGIENLSRSFLNHLIRLDGVNHYQVLVPTTVKYDFDLRCRSNFKMTPIDGPGCYWRELVWQGACLLHRLLKIDYWRSPEVERLSRAHALKAEVALSIPGYIHPDLHPLSNVLVVPDIQHEYCPEFFSPEALKERRHVYTDSIKRANHLCAISEFTRQTLIERLGISPEKVTTTHLAADPCFHPGSVHRGNPEAVLQKHGLPAGGYLFFPGHTWPHKNHRTAFEAMKILEDVHHLQPLLVCTGNPKEAHGDILNLIRRLRLDGRIRFLGYCRPEEMPALYEGAAALVFPSLFEGFGMPVLEAMWCDCPVVCSNSTSLPEVAGDAALLVDPRSPEELAGAINRILEDEPLRKKLIGLGRLQAKKFSWHKFTVEIIRILHRVRNMDLDE